MFAIEHIDLLPTQIAVYGFVFRFHEFTEFFCPVLSLFQKLIELLILKGLWLELSQRLPFNFVESVAQSLTILWKLNAAYTLF